LSKGSYCTTLLPLKRVASSVIVGCKKIRDLRFTFLISEWQACRISGTKKVVSSADGSVTTSRLPSNVDHTSPYKIYRKRELFCGCLLGEGIVMMQECEVAVSSHDKIISGNLLFFVVCLFFLAVVYSSAFQAHYLLQDDYNLVGQVHQYPERSCYPSDVKQGRFINSFLTNWQVYRLLDNSENGHWFRLFSLLPLSLLALTFHVVLRRLGRDLLEIWLFPLCLILLMPFQIIPLWIALMGSSFALILAILAFLLFWRVSSAETPFSVRRLCVGFSVSFLIELTALNMYEPFAMFYWTLPAFVLLLDNQYLKHRVVSLSCLAVYTMAGLCAMAARLMLPKIVLPLLGIVPAKRTEMLVSNISELLERVWWFMTEPLVRGLNFWNFPHVIVTGVVLTVIVIGVASNIFCSVRQDKGISWSDLVLQCEKYLIILSLILLSYSPNLVVSSCAPRYRTFIAFTPILFLLFWQGCAQITTLFLGKNTRRAIGILLLFLLSAGMYSATKNSYVIASLNDLDRRVMESQIDSLLENTDPEDINRIHVRHFGERHKSIRRCLEFGYVSSAVDFAVRGMVVDVLYRKGVDVRRLKITASPDEEEPIPGPGIGIVDMGIMHTFIGEDDI